MNLSTTILTTSKGKDPNGIIASSLFLNSGAKSFSIASPSAPSLFSCLKPIAAFDSSWAPALVVIINIVFLKSIAFPLLSVNLP